MKKKIRQFFDDRALETWKLMQNNPNKNFRQLTKNEQRRLTEIGQVKVYNRIQSGEEIRPIKIGVEVWRGAEVAHSNNIKSIELEYEENRIKNLTLLAENYKQKYMMMWCLVGAIFYIIIGTNWSEIWLKLHLWALNIGIY